MVRIASNSFEYEHRRCVTEHEHEHELFGNFQNHARLFGKGTESVIIYHGRSILTAGVCQDFSSIGSVGRPVVRGDGGYLYFSEGSLAGERTGKMGQCGRTCST